MTARNTGLCRVAGCEAPVRWVASAKTGRWMILDRDPVDGGNIALVDDPLTCRPFAHVGPDPKVPGPRYQVHQVTCRPVEQVRQPGLFDGPSDGAR